MDLMETSLVLVAIMPLSRDMDIARMLGWYRIPLKTAPKILHVDIIAFYQTGNFAPGHKSRIETFAELRGIELTTRRELFRNEPEHPKADEEYYKLQLSPLQSLPSPILADEWKRFAFFYTTGEKLLTAKSIRGLAVNSAEKTQIWRSLREKEIAFSGRAFQTPEPELPSDLLFLLGNLKLSGLDLK